MSVGKDARSYLTSEEQEALTTATTLLLDSLFEEWHLIEDWEPESILATKLGKHLPIQYVSDYTPLFFKKVGICVITVAWKLVQPKLLPLASVAEQLAMWAILTEAKEGLKSENTEGGEKEGTQAFQSFIGHYFEDTHFLTLFDERGAGSIDQLSSLPPSTCENWFQPFSCKQKHIPHPYAFSTERGVGQAYKHWLTPSEREALATGIEILIDGLFEDFTQADSREPQGFLLTTLGWHLPQHYVPKYTILFLKQFSVCIITVAWKLAQPKRLAFSSIGEELAAWAILEEGRNHIELMQEEEPYQGTAPEDAFEDAIDEMFEDTDFTFLFDERYDGIETSLVGQWLHMTSLAFEDWLKPFTDEPDHIAHPYVFGKLQHV